MTSIAEPSETGLRSTATPPSDVQFRRLPYPYGALLAICSDLDETPDRHVYAETIRFLNTTQTTSFGEGVGLEVGNTIYFDMPPEQFSYWNTDDAGRAMLRAFIESGHIDCLHSYGDFAATRERAARALDELCRVPRSLEVWIDHAVAPSNFGADIMRGLGDVPGSAVYHADLTCDYGIKYVWRGRVTSVTGQETQPRLRGIFTPQRPVASAKTLVKEATKRVLASRGGGRYAIHGPNRVIRPTTLRDGRPVLEFLRCNPHWGGVSSADTADGLADVLTREFLDRLVERAGVCVLYTHLGKSVNRAERFGLPTIAALRRLADDFRSGRVLVTTTRRLLGYCRTLASVRGLMWCEPRRTRIELTAPFLDAGTESIRRAGDSDGITCYVPDERPVQVSLNGRDIVDTVVNPPDRTGRPSVSLPWPRLSFPEVRGT